MRRTRLRQGAMLLAMLAAGIDVGQGFGSSALWSARMGHSRLLRTAPTESRVPRGSAAVAPLRTGAHLAGSRRVSRVRCEVSVDDELSWLQRNLPVISVCEADREDKSLARSVAKGHKLWRESAEGRNVTMAIPTRRVGARLDDPQSRLLLANMGLVLQLARRYRHKGVSLADLVQEGSLGLLHAMHKFDPERNVKFVTFAYYWVHQYLSRAVANKGHTIRLPVYVHEARRRLLSARADLLAEGVSSPTDEQVAERAGVPLRRTQLLHSVPSVVSLDSALPNRQASATMSSGRGYASTAGVGSRRAASMTDLIAAEQLRPDEVAQERMFRAELDFVLSKTLSPKHHRIVRLRYGLDDGRPKRPSEISRELGVDAQVVRRAEKSALAKLRKTYAKTTKPRPRLRAELKYRQGATTTRPRLSE